MAAARLQRWATLLSAYDYHIQYKSTHSHSNAHSNADGLSRLPLQTQDTQSDKEGVTIFNIAQVQALPATFKDVQKATSQDKILSKVLSYAQCGWPEEEIKPYKTRQHEIGVETGCLMWGIRVIIPKSLQSQVLK